MKSQKEPRGHAAKGGNMKFLGWLFSLERRHRFGVRAYERGGAGIRLLTLLMYVVLFGGTLGLEYWAISTMLSGQISGVLVLILAIIVGLAAVEYCLSYSFVGFRMFFKGCVGRLAYRANVAEGVPDEKPVTHRALDMVVAVAGIIFALAVIFAFIAMFVILMS